MISSLLPFFLGGALWPFLEARLFLVKRHYTLYGALHNPFRCAFFSDWHLSPLLPRLTRTLEKEQPDLILFGGDFLTCATAPTFPLDQLFAPLAAIAPVYACLGNHDYTTYFSARNGIYTAHPPLNPWKRLLLPRLPEVAPQKTLHPALQQLKSVEFLHNTCTEITLKGNRITLVGSGDVWAEDCSPPTPTNPFSIGLVHNPEAAGRLHNVTLTLCGHTHGGYHGFSRKMYGYYPDKKYLVSSGLSAPIAVRCLRPPEWILIDFLPQ